MVFPISVRATKKLTDTAYRRFPTVRSGAVAGIIRDAMMPHVKKQSRRECYPSTAPSNIQFLDVTKEAEVPTISIGASCAVLLANSGSLPPSLQTAPPVCAVHPHPP